MRSLSEHNQTPIYIRNRIKLLMEYNPKMTYTENLMNEQSWAQDLVNLPNMMLGLGGYDAEDFWRNQVLIPGSPWWNTVTLGGTYDWVSTWNTSDWATFAEIAIAIAAPFTGPFAPGMIALAGAIGVANGANTVMQGDPYTGGMQISLTLLGLGFFSNLPKQYTKTLMEMGGPKEAVKVIQAAKAGTATKKQLKNLGKMGQELAPVSTQIAKATLKQTAVLWAQTIGKKSLEYVLMTFMIAKTLGVELVKMVVFVAGTAYTYDEILLALTHEKSKIRRIRNDNGLAKLKDQILLSEEELKQQSLNNFLYDIENGSVSSNGASKTMNINPDEMKNSQQQVFKKSEDEYNAKRDAEQKELDRKKQLERIPPTISQVQLGQTNQNTGQIAVFKLNMKGDVILKIQNMLGSLGDEFIDAMTMYGKYPKHNDGFYGEGTEEGVKIFQVDNGLKETGIIDKLTMRKLLEKTKKQ